MSLQIKNIFNRPLSPHLTIYSSELTSIYSIWHRITGLILILILITNFSILKFSTFFVLGGLYEFFFVTFLWIKNSFFINFIIFFCYHMLNGIRHIIWDLGFILPINKVLISAKFINLCLFFYSIYYFFQILN